jgi:hypothetical protein
MYLTLYKKEKMVKEIKAIEMKFTHNLNFGKYKIEKICINALAIIALNNMNKKIKLVMSVN